MGYKNRDIQREYQKGIPKELKREYQRRYREGKEDKKKQKNLVYRLQHGQKTIKKKELKKLKSCIDF